MELYDSVSEVIELSLPANAAYVSAARLTASSIANRVNFDIDEIEDIKSAVSEACAFLIKTLPHDLKAAFKIKFSLGDAYLEIDFYLKTDGNFTYSEDDMSVLMIKGLVDSFETNSQPTGFTMKIRKTHKVVSFD